MLGPLGVVLGWLGAVLGHLRAKNEEHPSQEPRTLKEGGRLGASWPSLGLSWVSLDVISGILGRLEHAKKQVYDDTPGLGCLLGRIEGLFGVILGASWPSLGPPWASLGVILSILGRLEHAKEQVYHDTPGFGGLIMKTLMQGQYIVVLVVLPARQPVFDSPVCSACAV